ncbi:hypothetical protein LAZ67_20000989 [Cordylochernes scorpioides]|uniref:Uncharacterized protein n=1 Tax=Cordylochernes scorpioides TaxID=51811 RepID=A0ABY6LM36_9ARAC|nr:hypothetical protein LAZ67_20000989 [Cordylochernes scorpioides]
MVETRSGKMQDTSEERLKTEESVKPQPSATIYKYRNRKEATVEVTAVGVSLDVYREWPESLMTSRAHA